jgi:hypothetical protein
VSGSRLRSGVGHQRSTASYWLTRSFVVEDPGIEPGEAPQVRVPPDNDHYGNAASAPGQVDLDNDRFECRYVPFGLVQRVVQEIFRPFGRASVAVPQGDASS